jgi:hypothetical protein
MSPYYFYSRTRCGIPRIKILGTKEDWTALETKLFKMVTEVFRGEMAATSDDDDYDEPRIVSYLKRAIEVVQKIHTETSPKYWEEMYKIDKCRSGHSNYVIGWINNLYKHSRGDDFYNYEPHISTVAYKDNDSKKEYELRAGLLYSSIEKDASDLDQKFPWYAFFVFTRVCHNINTLLRLVPHFAHVVLDKSIKMTVDQFRNYVDKALDGTHYSIFNNFFDVLKDDPIFLVSGLHQTRKQRLEIVGRQLDEWIAHPEQTTQIDFSPEKFQDVFRSFSEDDMGALTEGFLSKVKTLIDTCHIRSVNLTGGEHDLLLYVEDKIVQMLIGKAELEELAIKGYSISTEDAGLKVLCELLLHPQCNLKSLNLEGKPYEEDSLDLAKALLNMERPLEKIELQKIADNELADAILELAANRNLKRLYCGLSYDSEIDKKVLLALARASALEDALIFSIADESRSEVYEELANNLPLHSNLTKLTVTGRDFDAPLLTRMLSIPSLRRLEVQHAETDFKFLSKTPLIQYIKAHGESEAIAEFLKSDTCQLQELDIWTNNIHLDALGASLVENKSLQILKVSVTKERDQKTSTKFGDFLANALDNGIPLRLLDTGVYLRVEPETMHKIVKAVTHHPYLERLVVDLSEIVSEEAMESVIELVKTNKILKDFYVFNHNCKPVVKWTQEQKNRLKEALEQSDTLTGFSMTEVWSSQYTLKNEKK